MMQVARATIGQLRSLTCTSRLLHFLWCKTTSQFLGHSPSRFRHRRRMARYRGFPKRRTDIVNESSAAVSVPSREPSRRWFFGAHLSDGVDGVVAKANVT